MDQEPDVYSQFFDESENGTFEVPPRRAKYILLKINIWWSKVVRFQKNNIAFVLCPLLFALLFFGDKIAAGRF